MDPTLDAPQAPFAYAGHREGSSSSLGTKSGGGYAAPGGADSFTANSRPGSSLSQHYLPQKFAPLSNIRKRGAKPEHYTPIPKRGGGREAFAAGTSRMPAANDEDYDGVQSGWFGGDGAAKGKGGGKLKWNRFKWILLVANTLVSVFITAQCSYPD
jgi:hypothetical protein